MHARARRLIGMATLAVVVAGGSAFVGTLGAAAKTAPPPTGKSSWQLEDYQQRGCFSPNVHDHYFGIYIDGRWTTSIDVGASNLPAGGTYDTSYAPIPPGSSDGLYS